MANLLLTGGTGLLGSNIIFETLKHNYENSTNHKLWLMGRHKESSTIKERIENIILKEGLDYIFDDNQVDHKFINSSLKNNIHTIETNLNKSDLGISVEDLNELKKIEFDSFIHSAGNTGFKMDNQTFHIVNETNTGGIVKILALLKELNVGKFCYISSAYSSGAMSGLVKPDRFYDSKIFPNYYQHSKYLAEIMVREFGDFHNIPVVVFRPATIGGRLMQKEFGHVNKYDVHLGWTKAFLRIKSALMGSKKIEFDKKFSMPFRLHINKNAGMNFVAVDFCAKLIFHRALDSDRNDSYHLASYKALNHQAMFSSMLKWINYNGVEFQEEMPTDLNDVENYYYSGLGKIFDMYVTTPLLDLDTTSMKELETKYNVSCPNVDEENFNILMEYGIKNNLGYPQNPNKKDAA